MKDLKSTLNKEGESTDLTFELIDKMLIDDPSNERLWDARGNYIQRYSGNNESLSFEEAKRCYCKSIECNPTYARGYESLGYFYDVIEANYELAEYNFRQAIAIDSTMDSYLGLARVLAQQNRKKEALKILSPESCPFSDDIDIKLLADAIDNNEWSSAV